MFARCPDCHKFFAAKVVDREDLHAESSRIYVRDIIGTTDAKTEHITYRYTYQCKHCGHRWTEIVRKTI